MITAQTEMSFVYSPLIIILIITGILFLVITALYNLSGPAAEKIRYILKFPLKLINSGPKASIILKSVQSKVHSIDLSAIKKISKETVQTIKKFSTRIYKLENIYLQNFIRNLDELITLLGLVSRKLHEGGVKVYTAYLLGFIVLFYIIF